VYKLVLTLSYLKSFLTFSFTIVKNIRLTQKPNTSKKVWAAPTLELIDVKSKITSNLLPGVNLRDTHS
jgi:hypothetical protein